MLYLFPLVQSTFLDDSVSVEHARDYGHIHLSEVRILEIPCYSLSSTLQYGVNVY